eukprot:PITA_31001
MDIGCVSWYSVLGITSAIVFLVLDMWRRRTYGRLPPGPPGWPIVGNLLQLGNKPNESLFHLATKYGPLMCVSLGMKTTVVVSSPAMAKEVLKTHDDVLAGRTVIQSMKYVSHDKSSLIWAQCGSHWRKLRRVSNTELFSVKRLETLQHLRREQVLRTIQQIMQEVIKGHSINIEDTMVHSAVNLLGNMAFGKDMLASQAPAFREFKESISKMMENAAVPNLADYFPFLQWLDPQGVGRNTKIYFERVWSILEKFIEDRLAKRGKTMDENDGPKDLLDVLLDMRSDEFSLIDIRGYLTDIFGAGSENLPRQQQLSEILLCRNKAARFKIFRGFSCDTDKLTGPTHVAHIDAQMKRYALSYYVTSLTQSCRLHSYGAY